MGASASKKPPGALRGLMKQKTRFALQRARSPFFFFFEGFSFFLVCLVVKKKDDFWRFAPALSLAQGWKGETRAAGKAGGSDQEEKTPVFFLFEPCPFAQRECNPWGRRTREIKRRKANIFLFFSLIRTPLHFPAFPPTFPPRRPLVVRNTQCAAPGTLLLLNFDSFNFSWLKAQERRTRSLKKTASERAKAGNGGGGGGSRRYAAFSCFLSFFFQF